MITLKDIQVSNHEISLTALIGKPIKDIRGYITMEFGGPVFKMTYVELGANNLIRCEGEHDLPYLVNWPSGQPNLDEETLERLYDEDDY